MQALLKTDHSFKKLPPVLSRKFCVSAAESLVSGEWPSLTTLSPGFLHTFLSLFSCETFFAVLAAPEPQSSRHSEIVLSRNGQYYLDELHCAGLKSTISWLEILSSQNMVTTSPFVVGGKIT